MSQGSFIDSCVAGASQDGFRPAKTKRTNRPSHPKQRAAYISKPNPYKVPEKLVVEPVVVEAPTSTEPSLWHEALPEIVALFFTSSRNALTRQYFDAVRTTCKAWALCLPHIEFENFVISRKSLRFVNVLSQGDQASCLRSISCNLQTVPFIHSVFPVIQSGIQGITITYNQDSTPISRYDIDRLLDGAFNIPMEKSWNIFNRKRCGNGWNGSDFMIPLTPDTLRPLNEVYDHIMFKTKFHVHLQYGTRTIFETANDTIYLFTASNADAEVTWKRCQHSLGLKKTPPLQKDCTPDEIFEPFFAQEWPQLKSLNLILRRPFKTSEKLADFLFKLKSKNNCQISVNLGEANWHRSSNRDFMALFSPILPFMTSLTLPKNILAYEPKLFTDYEKFGAVEHLYHCTPIIPFPPLANLKTLELIQPNYRDMQSLGKIDLKHLPLLKTFLTFEEGSPEFHEETKIEELQLDLDVALARSDELKLGTLKRLTLILASGFPTADDWQVLFPTGTGMLETLTVRTNMTSRADPTGRIQDLPHVPVIYLASSLCKKRPEQEWLTTSKIFVIDHSDHPGAKKLPIGDYWIEMYDKGDQMPLTSHCMGRQSLTNK